MLPLTPIVLKTSALAIAMAFACASCSRPPAAVVPLETPAPAEPELPRAAATPVKQVTAVATPAVASPAPDPLAPEGVFFLIGKASVTTDAGIIGVKVGTRLELISPGVYRDGEGHTLELAASKVTNNLRIASVASRSDAAAQAAWRQATARAEAAAARPALVATNISTTQSPSGNSSSSSKSIPTPAGRPNTGALGALHHIDKAKEFVDRNGRRNWKDAKGTWHID